MKIVAVIPSRYGSTRFIGKPLVSIAGKPMIQRAYERASRSTLLSSVFVATDDRRIFEAVESFGGNAVMTSPDLRSGTDRVAEAVESMDLDDGDVVINVQGDQPHFPPQIIDEVAKPLIDNPDQPMATLVIQMTDPQEITHPNFVKTVIDGNGYALYFSRSVVPFSRDGIERAVYWKHLGFYSYRRSFLRTFAELPTGVLEEAEKLEQLRALEYGYRIKIQETEYDSIEVDTLQDARRVEQQILAEGE